MRISVRSWLGVLAGLVAVAVPGVSSAQATTPVDQLFVVASRQPVTGTGAESLNFAVTPATFGCSASQAFFVRTVMVSLNVTQVLNQYQTGNFGLSFEAVQSRQGTTQSTSPAFYGSAAQQNNLFVLPSIGVPISSFKFSKNNFAGDVSLFFWGYCGATTTLGALTMTKS